MSIVKIDAKSVKLGVGRNSKSTKTRGLDDNAQKYVSPTVANLILFNKWAIHFCFVYKQFTVNIFNKSSR